MKNYIIKSKLLLLAIFIVNICSNVLAQVGKKTSFGMIVPPSAVGYQAKYNKTGVPSFNVIILSHEPGKTIRYERQYFQLQGNMFYKEFNVNSHCFILPNVLDTISVKDMNYRVYELNTFLKGIRINYFVEEGDSIIVNMSDLYTKHYLGKGIDKFICIDSLLAINVAAAQISRPDSYKERLNFFSQLKDRELAILTSYKQKLSSRAYNLIHSSIMSRYGRRILEVYDKYLKDYPAMEPIDNFLKRELSSLVVDEETVLSPNVETYLYLKAKHDVRKLVPSGEKDSLVADAYNLIKQNYTGDVQRHMLTFLLRVEMQYIGLNPMMTRIIDDFRALGSHHPSVKEYIFDKYEEKRNQVADRKKAFNFSLMDTLGNIVQLDDLKGKLIYLDFWASYCQGCVENMKFSKILHEKFKARKDVEFVYVSMDSNLNQWKDAMNKVKVEGIHLIADREGQVGKNYGISGLPRYMIIGKDGTLLNLNAPHPSETKAVDLLNNYLKQQTFPDEGSH